MEWAERQEANGLETMSAPAAALMASQVAQLEAGGCFRAEVGRGFGGEPHKRNRLSSVWGETRPTKLGRGSGWGGGNLNPPFCNIYF